MKEEIGMQTGLPPYYASLLAAISCTVDAHTESHAHFDVRSAF